MSEMPVIAVDAMGGDLGPQVIVPAATEFLASHDRVRLQLVGSRDRLESLLAGQDGIGADRLEIVEASQIVSMDELPADALRKKKDSSMRVALNQVRDGHAQACVSAGNTGALMATSRFVLKMLPGIDRPAICTSTCPRASRASRWPRKRWATWEGSLGAPIVATAFTDSIRWAATATAAPPKLWPTRSDGAW